MGHGNYSETDTNQFSENPFVHSEKAREPYYRSDGKATRVAQVQSENDQGLFDA
jgi:hypothetical protein